MQQHAASAPAITAALRRRHAATAEHNLSLALEYRSLQERWLQDLRSREARVQAKRDRRQEKEQERERRERERCENGPMSTRGSSRLQRPQMSAITGGVQLRQGLEVGALSQLQAAERLRSLVACPPGMLTEAERKLRVLPGKNALVRDPVRTNRLATKHPIQAPDVASSPRHLAM